MRTRRGERLRRCKAVKCGPEILSTYVFRTAVTLSSRSGRAALTLWPREGEKGSCGRETMPIATAHFVCLFVCLGSFSSEEVTRSSDKSGIDEKYRWSAQSIQLLSEKWQFFARNGPGKYCYSKLPRVQDYFSILYLCLARIQTLAVKTRETVDRSKPSVVNLRHRYFMIDRHGLI